MQGTQGEANVNRPIAYHGRHKPDPRLVIALVEQRLTELPANSLRRIMLEAMIDGDARLTSSREICN